ncbi:DMT family transporter [Clostridium botulinum]|uniref:DMT family transporter n=1 Tax=Clostridium botulinum TaxID=1491 RepID=A0A846J6Z8_CLOBO|nr:DMT family transporter [Clostridium botulinum]ACA56863.1 putative membrane protein [Clostridium botulinum A3 str. Loch Maree]NFH64942.1 DMT family transporter [Clostridium botulinum]NFJ08960.1 DMT family transporter [Clostridium botulinum]NFK16228.1 DMT family transporter [Clostridium botulinum]NFM92471.1 DMT family transporter [Clostridium botulinum]
MQITLYLIIGIIIGMFFPIQASISARLSSYSKTPLTASLIAFSLGTVILLIINLIVDPAGITVGIDFSYPLYVFIGGAIAGVGFNVANIILFSKLGASVTTIVTVTGQMIVGILIDHFGWFGVPSNPITITRAIGAIIMILAISLVQPKKKKDLTTTSEGEKKDNKITLIILGVLSGFLPPLQTAINGKLRVATGSLLGATFISFFVGTIILIILILITQRHLAFPLYDAQKNRIPIWTYIGGIFGIFIVTGNIVLLPALGSVLTTMIFLFGQMIMASTIDQFGMFNLQKRKIDSRRIAALVLTIIGIMFVKFL